MNIPMHDQSHDLLTLQNTAVLIEDSGSISANEYAQQLAKKLGVQVHTISKANKNKRFESAQWLLVFTENGLALRVASEPSWSDIRVDFASSALQFRKLHGGGRNELIAKAIGIKGQANWHVLDCTAGMGTDSFVMASVGAKVTMIERSPIISELLADALMRATDLGIDVANNMALFQSNAIDYLNSHADTAHNIDVLYLDPMFPHKKKSALVKKEMQAFQLLLGPDQDSEALLTAAVNFAPKRIVVKRPASAPVLDNKQGILPTMALSSKKHRFDVYLLTNK